MALRVAAVVSVLAGTALAFATADADTQLAAASVGYTATYIPAGSGLPEFVAVNPATDTVYLTEGNASMIVLDGANQTVTATINLPWQTSGVAVDSATDTIYVVTDSGPVKEIGVIDGSTNSVVGTISLPTGENPTAIAVDSTTNRIYVAESTGATAGVVVIDGNTEGVITTVSVGDGEQIAMAADQSTGMVWVAGLNGAVTAMSEATDEVIGTVQISGEPLSLAVNPATNTVYVAARSTGQQAGGIAVIDGSTTTLTTTLAVADIGGVAVDPGTDVVYASTGGGTYGDTTMIDGASDSVIDTLERGGYQAAVDTVTGAVYETAVVDFRGFWVFAPSATNAMSPIIAPIAPTFTVGTPGSVALDPSAIPAATVTETGALPAGITLSPAGVLTGTPAAATAGYYPITVTASNGVAPDYGIYFDITVASVPAITSADQAVFGDGDASSFAVTSDGFPAPTFTESGTLPAGVTLSGNGVLSGSPAGLGTRYPITITATNAGGATTQAFTLIVDVPDSGPAAGGVLGDVTGNGLADILAIDGSGNLWLYPNTGSGDANMFGDGRSQVGTGWTGYTLAATANLYGATQAGLVAIAPSGSLWYYPNTGNAAFGTRSLIGTGWTGYTVIGVTDLYGTGEPGILATDPAGNLWYYPNTGGTGTGTFGAPTQVGSGWTGWTADAADINGDGTPDLLAVDPSGTMWLYPNTDGGTGTATFGTPTQLSTGWSGYQAIDTGLLTGAGPADILGIDPAGNLWYYPNTGTGTYTTPIQVGTGWTGYHIN